MASGLVEQKPRELVDVLQEQNAKLKATLAEIAAQTFFSDAEFAALVKRKLMQGGFL
jgi:hypothetical protein